MRIVSLLPSATEILFAIGAGDEVVGVTHECDFPEEVRRLPKLTASSAPPLQSSCEIDRHVRNAVHAGSSLYFLDSALLERLDPDLIVTQELCPVCAVSYEIVEAAATCLRTSGEPEIVSLEPSSLEEVFANILFLGALTGRSPNARHVVDGLQQRMDEIARRRPSRNRETPRTLVLEWTDPPMSAGHWIPQLVELAGGIPLLANPGTNSQRLEWDAIAAADPDAVIVTPCGFDLERTKAEIAALDAVAQWRGLRARQSGRVLAVDGNAYFSRPGPRLVDSAEILAQWYAAELQ
jgi:iron complex transport system substrate-binding protein